MAQMVVGLLEKAIRKTLPERRLGSQCVVAAHEQRGTRGPPLWAPILSKSEEASVGACYKDRSLERRIHKAAGFSYVVEGTDAKMKPGIVGYKPGASVQFCLDVSRLQPDEKFAVIVSRPRIPCDVPVAIAAVRDRRHDDGLR